MKKSIVHGLARTDYLKSLHAAGVPLCDNDPVLQEEQYLYRMPRVQTDHGSDTYLPLAGLLERLAASSCVLLLEEDKNDTLVRGLVTTSDINNRELRSSLYWPIASVEQDLADLIKEHVDDSWNWIRQLNTESQARVIGHWVLARQRNVDLDPVSLLSMTQLLEVVGKAQDLLHVLGYKSRSQLEHETGRLPELRNRVMHPVRLLLMSPSDLAWLREAVLGIEHLQRRIATARNRPILSRGQEFDNWFSSMELPEREFRLARRPERE